MDPKLVFESTSRTISRVMEEPARGLYIPAYQRKYRWNEKNVAPLLGSICEGLLWLEGDEKAITVLGTLIFALDTQKATVEPAVRDDLPGSVFLVIDGQQRLTTMAILVAALDDHLRRAATRIASADPDLSQWASRVVAGTARRLQRMLFFDRELSGDGAFRYYPRLIRAFSDSWSTDPQKARYTSPLAAFLHAYVGHVVGTSPNAQFKWKGSDEEEYKVVERVYASISKRIKQLADGDTDEEEPDFPDLGRIASSESLCERFFPHMPSREVATRLASAETAWASARYFARVAILVKYVLDRVAVTQVEVSNQDYAFDLFEALNTTGEPLTAYETFKPLVIRTEGLDRFRHTASFSYLDRVDAYFAPRTSDEREACNELLVPFALFESGHKLGKHLRNQRNYLRNRYEQCSSVDAKRAFIAGMSHVADFLTDCWPPSDSENAAWRRVAASDDSEDLVFGLTVLHKAGHDITVALLARFYEPVLTASTDVERRSSLLEFTDAVRAVVAFFGLYRGSREGTKNIDMVYRGLMQGSSDFPGAKRSAGIRPTAEFLRTRLRHELAERGQVVSKEFWIGRASELQVFGVSKEVARLLLLAAGKDAHPSPSSPGLLVRGKNGSMSTLRRVVWASAQEIEHIVPQKNNESSSWEQSVYREQKIDCLGNLWMLPSRENKSASNRSWQAKRYLYRALSSPLADTASIMAEAAAEGVAFSAVTTEVLESARYQPQLAALAMLPAEQVWDAEFVLRRSRNIAELAWSTLAPWLGIHGETVSDSESDD
jgi:hypothetical protein